MIKPDRRFFLIPPCVFSLRYPCCFSNREVTDNKEFRDRWFMIADNSGNIIQFIQKRNQNQVLK